MTKNTRLNRLLGRSLSATVIVTAGLMIAGCEHGRDGRPLHTGSLYGNPDKLHPIHVTKGRLAMGLKVRRGATKLLPYESNEVRTFLNYYRNQGTGQLYVSLPTHSAYQGAVNKMLYGLQGELVAMGLEPEMVKVKRYSGRGDRHPMIHMSFQRYEAHGPDCHEWNEDLAKNGDNANGRYWGCASQNNLAAMVGHARDLKGPRGWSPRDGRRRDMVWEKYIKGESTGADRSQDERVDAQKK